MTTKQKVLPTPSPGAPGCVTGWCEETWPAGIQGGRLQPAHTFPGGPLAKCPQASEGGQTSVHFPPHLPSTHRPLLLVSCASPGPWPVGVFTSPALCWTWISSVAQGPQATICPQPPAHKPRPRPTGDLCFCISVSPALRTEPQLDLAPEPCLLELPADTDRAQENQSYGECRPAGRGREPSPRNVFQQRPRGSQHVGRRTRKAERRPKAEERGLTLSTCRGPGPATAAFCCLLKMTIQFQPQGTVVTKRINKGTQGPGWGCGEHSTSS